VSFVTARHSIRPPDSLGLFLTNIMWPTVFVLYFTDCMKIPRESLVVDDSAFFEELVFTVIYMFVARKFEF